MSLSFPIKYCYKSQLDINWDLFRFIYILLCITWWNYDYSSNPYSYVSFGQFSIGLFLFVKQMIPCSYYKKMEENNDYVVEYNEKCTALFAFAFSTLRAIQLVLQKMKHWEISQYVVFDDTIFNCSTSFGISLQVNFFIFLLYILSIIIIIIIDKI